MPKRRRIARRRNAGPEAFYSGYRIILELAKDASTRTWHVIPQTFTKEKAFEVLHSYKSAKSVRFDGYDVVSVTIQQNDQYGYSKTWKLSNPKLEKAFARMALVAEANKRR